MTFDRSHFMLSLVGIFLLFSSGPTLAKKKDKQEIQKIARGYADCVVDKRPALARKAILSNADSADFGKKYKRLMIGKCLVKANGGKGGRMRFGGDHIRYSLAGALIRVDLQNQAPRSFEDVPRLSHFEPIKPDTKLMARDDRKGKKYRRRLVRIKSARILSIYGECVVRSDPVGSHSLVTSEIGSSEETASFVKLQPSLSSCVIGDGEFRFGKATLRGLVNVNYYRLAMASPTPAAQSAEASE